MSETSEQAEVVWWNAIEPPQPDEWWEGTVYRTCCRGFSFAKLLSGENVFVSEKTVVPERGHRCLKRGDQIALRIEKDTGNTQWRALECRLQTPRELPDEEKGFIAEASNTGRSYFVRLDCNCYIKTTASQFETFVPGDRVALSRFVPDRIKKGLIVATRMRRLEEAND